MSFINAINALANKPWAIIVLMIGCAMLVFCKKWAIDTTIAGGIIGVASNMLMSKPEPPDLPPGSQLHATQSVDTKVPDATEVASK
jgi:hypothetical protein